MSDKPATLTEAAMLMEKPPTPYAVIRMSAEGRQALRVFEEALDGLLKAYQRQLMAMLSEVVKEAGKP